MNATKFCDWGIVTDAIRKSEALLQATLEKDSEAVAKGVEAAHFETSHLQYNDENALSYTLSVSEGAKGYGQ